MNNMLGCNKLEGTGAPSAKCPNSMYVASTHSSEQLPSDVLLCVCVFVCVVVISMLNKNTLGVKKVRGQSEAALQTGATKNFDIS